MVPLGTSEITGTLSDVISSEFGREHLPSIVFGLLCFIWGSTWLAIKIGLEDSPPFLSAGLRFGIAGVILALIIKLKGVSVSYGRRTWLLMVLSGILIGLGYAAIYWGEQYIPSGLTAVLFATLPLFVALFAHFTLREERLSISKIAGIIVGFGGVVLIFSDSLSMETEATWWGASALLLSSAVLAAINILVKREFHQVNPVVLTAVQMGSGAVLLLLSGAIWERIGDFLITPNSVGALLYLSLVGTVFAFAIYYWLMKRIQVTRISLIILITPVVAVLLGWFLLEEAMNLKMIAGSGLVLAGVALAHR